MRDHRRSATGGLVALAVITVLLSGCSMGAGGASDSSSGGGSLPGVAEPAAPGSGVAESAAGTDSDTREVVTSGSLLLVVEDPIRSADEVSALVISTGGHLDGVSQYPESEYQSASASLIARIPEDRLDQALLDLKQLGTVQSLSTDSTDVTRQSTDYEVRIANLQAAVDRLRVLLADAADTSDLIEIENALTTREGELESLKAQRDSLAEQVAFATLSISLSTPSEVGAAAPGTFWDGFIAGFDALVLALAGLLIAVGAMLPWLIFLGGLALIALLIVRVVRRRRRARATAARMARDAAEPPATAQ